MPHISPFLAGLTTFKSCHLERAATTKLQQKAACVVGSSLSQTLASSFPPFFPPFPTRPFPLHPCVIVLNGASSRLALPSAGGERGAAGACGGVCCGAQSRRVFAAEPHMFTGSIPPVEPRLGRSRPRTGSLNSGSGSHRTAVFMCFFKAFREEDARKDAKGEIIRRPHSHVAPPKSRLRV